MNLFPISHLAYSRFVFGWVEMCERAKFPKYQRANVQTINSSIYNSFILSQASGGEY